MKLAVVGGRGWLGRAIVHAAETAGHDVRVVSRTPGPGVVVADPASPASLEGALAGVDVVVGAAGYRGTDPAEAHNVNVALPRRLGALAFTQGWRLVHLGSAAEYGNRPSDNGLLRLAEDHPCRPTTLYGRTKLSGSQAALEWRPAGAAVVVARVFNVVDADLPADNPVADIVAQLRHGGRRPIDVGDPTTVRDISRRDWVAAAVVALATSARGVQHPVVNVCSGVGTSFGQLAQLLASRLGLDVDVHDLGWPRGGRVVGNPSLLQSLAGLPPSPSPSDDDHRHGLVTSILGPSGPAVDWRGAHGEPGSSLARSDDEGLHQRIRGEGTQPAATSGRRDALPIDRRTTGPAPVTTPGEQPCPRS